MIKTFLKLVIIQWEKDTSHTVLWTPIRKCHRVPDWRSDRDDTPTAYGPVTTILCLKKNQTISRTFRYTQFPYERKLRTTLKIKFAI
jgi:hypothetical protein